jgi:hypothetical protein
VWLSVFQGLNIPIFPPFEVSLLIGRDEQSTFGVCGPNRNTLQVYVILF